VEAGREALQADDEVAADERRAAVRASMGKYGEGFSDDYLEALRRDWPA